MKNIEWKKGFTQELHPKIKRIINETNSFLEKNLSDDTILNEIKLNFIKILKFAKVSIKKIKTEEEFKQFMEAFWQLLKEIKIEKLYNNATLKNINEFSKLDLFSEFFYITTPLNNHSNYPFLKGWTCSHWSIFFFKLFKELDKENKLYKRLLRFSAHSACIVWFKNKKYIIDPFAKKLWLLTEIKKWNKVYLWANVSWSILWEIIDEKKLKIKYWNELIIPKKFNNIQNFIKSANNNQFLEVKTYHYWKSIHLVIKDFLTYLEINLNWKKIYREKITAQDDIISIYMREKNPKNYKILLLLMWLNEKFLDKNILKKVKIIAKKIDIDYLLEKLDLKEAVKMFQDMN